jgi:signal transduction histidine kinase
VIQKRERGALQIPAQIRKEMGHVHRLHTTVGYPRESALLARMQRMAGIGGWELDLVTGSLTWTSETYRIYEVTPACYAPTLESAVDFYIAEHVPVIRDAITQAMRFGTPFDLELEMITGRGRRHWVRAVGQVQRRGDQLRRVYGTVQEITEQRRLEQEMLAIARYDEDRTVSGLRDDLGQVLTGTSLMLRCLAKRMNSDAPWLSPDIEPIITVVNRAIGACSSLAKMLAPVSTDHGGSSAALRELAQAYGQSRGIDILVRECGIWSETVSASTSEQIFRIAQGALALVAEHGGATQVSIRIGVRHSSLILTVCGDTPASHITGSEVVRDVSMLRRRAKLLGAIIQIGPLPRGGMRVRCILRAADSSATQIHPMPNTPP